MGIVARYIMHQDLGRGKEDRYTGKLLICVGEGQVTLSHSFKERISKTCSVRSVASMGSIHVDV